MKKFISLCICLTLAMSLFVPCLSVSAAATQTILTQENFESTNGATTLDYFNGQNSWQWNYGATHASTTQTARATISFETADGNTVMQAECIRAKYNNTNSIWGNSQYKDTSSEWSLSERFLRKGFSTKFNATNFPDSKLVVSYDLKLTSQDPTNILNGEQFIAALIPAADGSKATALASYNAQIYQGAMYVNYSSGTRDGFAITDDYGAKTEVKRCIGIKSVENETETAAETMHITMVIDPGVSEQTYVNGMLASSTTRGVTDVNAIAFIFAGTANTQLDNIKAYTVADSFAMTSQTVEDNATGVKVDATTDFAFNNEIAADSLSKVVVKANDDTLTAGTDYNIDLVADEFGLKNKVSITFPNNMAYGTNYAITFGDGFVDGAYSAVTAKTVAFTTESKPEFAVDAIVAYKGWSENAESDKVTSLAGQEGAMVTFKVSAKNVTAGKAVYGALMVGLYDNGELISCGYVDKEFAIDATESYNCAMYMPDDVTNCEVNAFVCAGLNDLTPFGSTVSFK